MSDEKPASHRTTSPLPAKAAPAAYAPKRGRPRLHRDRVLTPAERQAAYRRRLIEGGLEDTANELLVDRRSYGDLIDALADLTGAIEAAARRGKPLAKQAAGKRRADLLRALAAAMTPAAGGKNTAAPL